MTRARPFKLAILGNSHVACLIVALRETPGILGEHVEATVFASTGGKMRHLQRSGTRLVPKLPELEKHFLMTSGGAAAVDLDACDAFLVVGMSYVLEPVPAAVTSAVLNRALENNIAAGSFWRIVDDIRKVSDRPILCGHRPLAAETPVEGVLAYEDLMRRYEALVRKKRVTLVRQPEETRIGEMFTRPEFTTGSVRLTGAVLGEVQEHRDTDVVHMNGAFGAIYLRAIADILTARDRRAWWNPFR